MVSVAEPGLEGRPQGRCLVFLQEQRTLVWGGTRYVVHPLCSFSLMMFILSVVSLLTWDVGLLKIFKDLHSCEGARSQGRQCFPLRGRQGA